MLEVNKVGACAVQFPTEGPGHACREEMITEFAAARVVHDTEDRKLVDHLFDNIAVLPRRVAMASEDSDLMATFAQDSRQSLGMSLDTPKGTGWVAVAYLKNAHGSVWGGRMHRIDFLANSGMQVGQWIVADERLHIAMVMRVHLANFLVVMFPLCHSGISE